MPAHISSAQAPACAQIYTNAADTAPPMPTPEAQAARAPEAAKPVLASTHISNLVRQHYAHQRYRNGHGIDKGGGNEAEEISKIKSGFGELDDYVLMGGVERGAVVGISGDVDGGGGGVGRLISLHHLTSVLLHNPVAKASIIDTTGSFSVSLLAKIIRHRTVSQLAQASHGVEKAGIVQTLDERVQEILGRVAISRVFDIEGIWEVLSEISADFQSPIPARDLSKDADRMSGQKLAVIENAETKSSGLRVEAGGGKELEIGDSEAEDEDIDLEDELREADISHRSRMDVTPDNADAPRSLPEEEDPTLRSKPPESIERTEIIIIDNMASPITELFSRREKASAHTLLSTFSRTLHTLSQTHNILTILLNTLTYQPARGPSGGASRHSASRLPTKPISIFAATTARPALGRLFSDLCALHLLVTSVPKTPKDAELLYVSPPEPSDDDEESRMPRGRDEGKTGVEYAFVVEVLKDTTPDLSSWLELSLSSRDTASIPPFSTHYYDRRTLREHSEHVDPRKRKRKQNRSQRWAPFIISPDGLELQDAFPGMTERPVSASGQTHIAKQFPFGRRA